METVPQCRDNPALARAQPSAGPRRPQRRGRPTSSRPRGLTPAAHALCRPARAAYWPTPAAPATTGQTAYGEMAACVSGGLCPTALCR